MSSQNYSRTQQFEKNGQAGSQMLANLSFRAHENSQGSPGCAPLSVKRPK